MFTLIISTYFKTSKIGQIDDYAVSHHLDTFTISFLKQKIPEKKINTKQKIFLS